MCNSISVQATCPGITIASSRRRGNAKLPITSLSLNINLTLNNSKQKQKVTQRRKHRGKTRREESSLEGMKDDRKVEASGTVGLTEKISCAESGGEPSLDSESRQDIPLVADISQDRLLRDGLQEAHPAGLLFVASDSPAKPLSILEATPKVFNISDSDEEPSSNEDDSPWLHGSGRSESSSSAEAVGQVACNCVLPSEDLKNVLIEAATQFSCIGIDKAKASARKKRRQAKIHNYVYNSACEAMSSSETQSPETDHKVHNYWIGDEDPEDFTSPLASTADDVWQFSGAASPSLDSAASLLLDEANEEKLERASEKEDFDEQTTPEAWCMFWWHELWSSEAFEELLPFEAKRKQAAPAVLFQCLPFYLSVEDFVIFRLLCRETSDRKVWNRQIIAAVKPMRVEGYVEYFQFVYSSTNPTLVGPPPTLPPNCGGFQVLDRLLEQWWEFGDQNATLRFFETMRGWSRESNREEVRHLLLYFAQRAVQTGDKSLRHFFARDVLHWLEHGDEYSQYLASVCLKRCEMGVGRFNGACLKALKHLTDEEHVSEHYVWFAAMGGKETLERCESKKKQKLGNTGRK